jgi:hypothetical protein
MADESLVRYWLVDLERLQLTVKVQYRHPIA